MRYRFKWLMKCTPIQVFSEAVFGRGPLVLLDNLIVFGLFCCLQKRVLMRNPPKPAPSCGGSARTTEQMAFASQALSARQYPLQLASTIHLMQPWFHGNISRDETVRLISEQGLVDGLVKCFALPAFFFFCAAVWLRLPDVFLL
jgi:hypothetical protein